MAALDPTTDLADLLRRAAAGDPPPADGSVTVLPQAPGPVAAVLAFTNHHVIAADVEPAWVHDRLAHGDMSAPVAAPFLHALGQELGRPFDNLDLVLVAIGRPGPPGSDLVEVPSDHTHVRVARSLIYRTEVRTFSTPGGDGVLIIGRGLAGRWEAAFEVDPSVQGRGMGRALAAAAVRLIPVGEPLYLQVSPGNVSSLRAVLATGSFKPLGAELLYPEP